jgi:S-adenosylmethionine decarboxylase
MQGLHLTADLKHCRCDATWLTDAPLLLAKCVDFVIASGLKAEKSLVHQFPGSACGLGGVTATVLLAESHLCVHTWPELKAVTLDVYVCNYGSDHSSKARQLLGRLLALFDAQTVAQNELKRGT